MSAERPAASSDKRGDQQLYGESAAYRWEFACGHVTEGGNECADACPDCGDRDLRRKTPVAAKRQELSDEEILAMWRRGELAVRTGRIIHGNLCVCPEKGDGEWCDKCEGYALEQGQ